MKRSALILTVIAAAAVIALVVVATRGEQTEAGPTAAQGVVLDPLGGDVSPYLVGYYRCIPYEYDEVEQPALQENGFGNCGVVNTVFRFINPTANFLEKHVALFDDEENLIGCYTDELTQNDLEIDNLDELLYYGWITDPETGEPIYWLPEEGVLKAVAVNPLFPSAIVALRHGIVGWAEYQLNFLDGFVTDGAAQGGDSTAGIGQIGISGFGVPVQLAAVPGLVLQQDQFSGPNQDIPGSDGQPDELVKIINNCNPEPEPTVTSTSVPPSVTFTPTQIVVATITPTSTPTPAPDVTPSATPDVTATATPWCFEVPGGLFCIPGGFIPQT